MLKAWASKMDEVGGWGSFAASLGVASLAMNGMPKNWKEGVVAANTAMSAAANLDDVAKAGYHGSRAIAEKLFKAGGKQNIQTRSVC